MSNSQSFPDLTAAMKEIKHTYKQLPPKIQTPKSFLSIIQSDSDELVWNYLLYYFLDPTQPHGFQSDILLSFLQLMAGRFDLPIAESVALEEVQVELQPTTDKKQNPDLLIFFKDVWLICIELKDRAGIGDTQLFDYANAQSIGECELAEFNHALYVLIGKEKHRKRVEADGTFEFLDWKDFYQQVLREYTEEVLHTDMPMRSVFQLFEFGEAIYKEAIMETPELTDRTRKLLQLYTEHYKALSEITDAWDDFEENWWRHFQDYCESEASQNSFEVADEEWHAFEKHGHIFKHQWWLDGGGEPVKDINEAAFRILFTHDLTRIPDGILAWRAQCNTRTWHKLRHKAPFISDEEDLKRRHTFDSDKRSFDLDAFPGSYFEALLEAFQDFTAEYEGQIDSFMQQVQEKLEPLTEE